MPQEQEQQESFFSRILKTLFWFWLFKNVMTAVQFYSSGGSSAVNPTDSENFSNLWKDKSNVKLKVFFSFKQDWSLKDSMEIWNLDFNLRNLEKFEKSFNMTLGNELQSNSSYYVHAFLGDGEDQIYSKKEITRFIPLLKNDKKNLFESNITVNSSSIILSHWWPNITITLVNYFDAVGSKMSPGVAKEFRMGQNGYYPFFYINDFWLLQDQLIPLNETIGN